MCKAVKHMLCLSSFRVDDSPCSGPQNLDDLCWQTSSSSYSWKTLDHDWAAACMEKMYATTAFSKLTQHLYTPIVVVFPDICTQRSSSFSLIWWSIRNRRDPERVAALQHSFSAINRIPTYRWRKGRTLTATLMFPRPAIRSSKAASR